MTVYLEVAQALVASGYLSGAAACAGDWQVGRERQDAILRNAPGWFESEKWPKDWQRQT